MANEQPGWRYVKKRLEGIFFSPVTVTPPSNEVVADKDVAVATRDGTTLRANVFRPAKPGRYPALISLHPYGKDNLPRKILGRYRPLITYRLLRQTAPITMSAHTGWEAPDPETWASFGYVVVNADLRGFFRSEGKARLLEEQEGQDYADLIEWAARQEWCNGNVGLSGVSYLCITQWRAAAQQPPSLKAICAWEGFTDLYRDLAFPGGVRERGFTNFWFGRLDRTRVLENLPLEQDRRPLFDAGWEAKCPDLAKIQVPALICGSFSDHNLHSRGSFQAFSSIGSAQKWLYTHRTGKWAAYYSQEAVALQKRFFDHFLKGESNGMDQLPPVRLEVREARDTIVEIRQEREWPLARTQWRKLFLKADGALEFGLSEISLGSTARFPFGRVSFSHTFLQDTELSGPMKLRLHVSIEDSDDLCVFAGVRKLRGEQHVVFEGSYGFGHDLVSRGWMRLSQRELDPVRSTDYQPVHTHRTRQPLRPGEVVPVEIEMLPSATLFRRGETLRVDLQGSYFFRHHPLLGQFPAGYEQSPPGTLTVHSGGEHDSYLLVPVIPKDSVLE